MRDIMDLGDGSSGPRKAAEHNSKPILLGPEEPSPRSNAFSGVSLLRFLIRLNDSEQKSSALELVASLSEEELRSVITSCLNHTEVLLPAGYQPVMQGSAWSWPELEHDTFSCLRLTIESISWSLSGFFGGGDLRPPPVAEEGR